MSTIDPIIVAQAGALMEGEENPITVLANASALLFNSIDDCNWAGFYIYSASANSLDLGPFQGQVACTHIAPGAGVVGTSFAQKQSLLVPNVHEFAGHIACDAASNSEVVVPLSHNGSVFAIMDLDSPSLARFSEADQATLTDFASVLSSHLDAARLSKVY